MCKTQLTNWINHIKWFRMAYPSTVWSRMRVLTTSHGQGLKNPKGSFRFSTLNAFCLKETSEHHLLYSTSGWLYLVKNQASFFGMLLDIWAIALKVGIMISHKCWIWILMCLSTNRVPNDPSIWQSFVMGKPMIWGYPAIFRQTPTFLAIGDVQCILHLVGGFKHFIFSVVLDIIIPVDEHIFGDG